MKGSSLSFVKSYRCLHGARAYVRQPLRDVCRHVQLRDRPVGDHISTEGVCVSERVIFISGGAKDRASVIFSVQKLEP